MADQPFALDQLTPAQPAARRRRAWPIWTAVVAVLLAGGIVALVVLLNRADTFTAAGTMSLPMPGLQDTNLRGDGVACDGASDAAGGGHSDIVAGAQVVISDSAGKTIAVSSLGAGATKGQACLMPFTVKNVPAGRGFYGIEISHRGRLQYSEADVHRGLTLTLG